MEVWNLSICDIVFLFDLRSEAFCLTLVEGGIITESGVW